MNDYDNFDQLLESTQQSQSNSDSFRQDQKKKQAELYQTANNQFDLVMQNSGAFRNYLDVWSRFLNISPTNALLVHAQEPNATEYHDYNDWREKERILIPPNAKGFYILGGYEFERDDGTAGRGYSPKLVYDISQTRLRQRDAEPYPGVATVIKALGHTSPVHIAFTEPHDLMSDTGEVFPALYIPDDNEIHVMRGLQPVEMVQALSVEIAVAHMTLEKGQDFAPEQASYGTVAAYMVCKRYGVDTNGIYIEEARTLLASMDSKDAKNKLKLIGAVAHGMQCAMDRDIREIEKTQRKEEFSRDDGR